MSFFDTVSDVFTAGTAKVERAITRMFGSSNERRVAEIGYKRDKDGNVEIVPGSILDRVNKFEPEVQKLTDEELRQSAEKFRARLAQGETLDDILPEVFAAVREAGIRFLKMRHYDVQVVGGVILHRGMIAEMVTGEGKTLVATLPTCLNALAGHVHVITVNDYLARRDMEWMSPLYNGLGLTVGAIQSNMNSADRQKAYACDITYGTNNEFGFDYLRDNMKPTKSLQAQGPLDFAVIDEIDNILIDEARTPLIISGPAHDDITKYSKADRLARELKRDVHFEVKEKEHSCHLTEDGVHHAEQLAAKHGYIKEGDSFYSAGNMEWPHLIDNSLKAHHLYKKDVNYMVRGQEIIIVDEHTGRAMEGRQWSDGLHQAVEAKEGVKIKSENQTLATITLQNFFKLYKKLGGMTGTAMTEAAEFWKVYKLDVVSIPTNRPLQRIENPDVIFCTEDEKWDAVIDEIKEVHKTGRPILVGTVSIENSELLSRKLDRAGIKHNVLNAKHVEREAEIVAQGGRYGAVTIATNMAGRGTDIILGGNPEHMAWDELKQAYESRIDVPKSVWEETSKRIAKEEGMEAEGVKVAEVGGLHVIGTERHESRRIDLQLRGRSGRQGDPGSSRFYLSLEDDLMRIFAGDWVKNVLQRLGMEKGESIENRFVNKRIEGAQKKVEERNFDIRKNLLEYDEVMDDQRKRVYSYRQRILDGENCRGLILEMVDRQVEKWVPEFLDDMYRWESIASWVGQAFGILVEPNEVRGMDREQLDDFLRDQAQRQSEELLQDQIDENLPGGEENEREWNWLALSKWANRHWGLNTNDRELKKIGRDDVFRYLMDRANEAIAKLDFSLADEFLAEDYPRKALCGWLNQQFTVTIEPSEFENLEVDEACTLVDEKIRELYREKEITFPVAVGMTNFLSDNPQQTGGEKVARERLVQWASDRFETEIDPETLQGKSRTDIETLLAERSRSYMIDPGVRDELEALLDEAYGFGGKEERNGHPVDKNALLKLCSFADKQLDVKIERSELESLSKEDARIRLAEQIESRYRPEIAQAERSLLLEVLDQSWKDHLYYMDHLRSTIGLESYAQKDPKVEYKRQGRTAFAGVWDRIGQQVTQAIFRLEKQSPEFVGSLWTITAATHAAAPQPQQQSGQQPTEEGPLPGQEDQVVDPIVNRGEKVGRNDPCPCGSGKKYKKCCGGA
ncbi:preprotein translocase subunit SecA [Thalassoroseus pseudoceratinae]|uniref:preprotein translocase subunit SecA n=1 Tax=Thalassoroseus pseudoceratinae TaxID=2713176 RepID=UPI00141F9901|nr:preprotein translocase subunit SecA [Thalassoroseus pseudoceratinae]